MKLRPRLRRMVAARLDPRLTGRVDPSDVVQETYIEAIKKLPEYLLEQPLPVYPWLRQIAVNRMGKLYQEHLHTQRRSVVREAKVDLGLSADSVVQLAGHLMSNELSPVQRLNLKEMQQEVRESLEQLPYIDREILILRFVEQLTTTETAKILGISQEAVGMRRLRAIRKMSDLMRGQDD